MTKMFEEELKDREAETFSYWDGCTISKKEFINYADVVNLSQGWVSPEEYEKLVKNCAVYVLECKNINRVNAQLTKENENLKSQLQQHALPVVPEDVDEAIKYLKKHNNSTLSDLDDILTAKGFSWLNDFQFKDRRFGAGGLNNKLFILSHLAITGYTVEKPQLFYLKHIDMSKRDKDHDYFAQIRNDRFEHDSVRNNTLPGVEVVGVKFTQQEIDSMQTGSYEQIEVTE